MKPEDDDIDRPLGLEERRAGRSRPHIRPIFLGLLALTIVAGSGAYAFRDQVFRGLLPPASDQQTTVAAKKISAPADAKEPAPGEPAAKQKDSKLEEEPSPPPETETIANGGITVRDPASLTQEPRLAHLPEPDLVQETEIGPLPIRAADGRRPFDVYAGSWSGTRGARIAIVIGGLGISQTGTQAAIAGLPSEITLAFAPRGNSLKRWMQTARREGHELILQVPLEPFGYPRPDPGPHTLLVEAPGEQNLENLHWALSRMTNYVGVMNYMGAKFTADERATGPFMSELGKRGLLFLDDGSSARSLAETLAGENKVPFAAGDLIIDEEAERGAILEKLDQLERTARARGFAVGSGSALETTVETVAAWASEVDRRGIELVPVSAVASDPERE